MKFLAVILTLVVGVFAVAPASGEVPLDASSVTFKLPDQIKWVENTKAGNRTAVLQGDPTKPGPYAMLIHWLPGNMSRPHFHPNDRHFIVVSGTWWVGTGSEFKPDATVGMPAGASVIHHAKGVHYDGAKSEQTTILVWGEGPATATPFGTPPAK